ncbi:MAG TPA: hypothetical protein VI298_08695 [Geobacteraceae bacterium]
MAKIRTLQSALNAGEFAPRLKGQVEIPRYAHGLEICRNFIPLVTGGITRTPGRRFVATKDAHSHSGGMLGGTWIRQIPFLFSAAGTLTGYVVELYGGLWGTGKAYFYTNGQQVANEDGTPYSVDIPYAGPEVPEVNYERNQNILYLFHPSHPPQRLTRTDDTHWTLEAVPFKAYPMLRPPNTDDITIAPSAKTGDIALVASAAFFQAGHVGVKFRVNGGVVQVTAVADATHASATVTTDIVPGATVSTRTDTITISQNAVVAFDPFDITTVANFTDKTLITTLPAIPDALSVTVHSSSAILTGTDPDKDWLEQAWSDLRGWPRSITFFEQRMIAAFTTTWPTTIWGSKNIEKSELDFTAGTLDSDAFSLNPTQADSGVYHMAAADQVFAFTATKELILAGSNDAPLTPTNIQIKARTPHGSSPTMRPIQVGNEMFFASLAGNRFRAFQYQFTTNGYTAPEFAILAEHLMTAGGGIVRAIYVAEPWETFFLVTANGHLLTFTYDATQQVYAWARHEEDGTEQVRDVCVVPDSSGQPQVWLAVERGNEIHTEFLDPALNSNAAFIGYDGAGKAEWTDIPAHLCDRPVDCVADGYVVQGLTVTGRTLTLPFPARNVEIGIHYQSRARDLPPGIIGGSVVLGAQLSVNRIRVWLHESKGCTINGEQVPFRQFGAGLLDQPVAAFTGMQSVGNMGWGDDGAAGQVEIVQDLPLPCTVLAVVKEVSIND